MTPLCSPPFNLAEVSGRWTDVGYLRISDPATKPATPMGTIRIEPAELASRGIEGDGPDAYARAVLRDIGQALRPGEVKDLTVHVMATKGMSVIKQYTLRVTRPLEEGESPPEAPPEEVSKRLAEADALSAAPGLRAVIIGLERAALAHEASANSMFSVLTRIEKHYITLVDFVQKRYNDECVRFDAERKAWAEERNQLLALINLDEDAKRPTDPQVKAMWDEAKPMLGQLAQAVPGLAAAMGGGGQGGALGSAMAKVLAVIPADKRDAAAAALEKAAGDPATMGVILSLLGVS